VTDVADPPATDPLRVALALRVPILPAETPRVQIVDAMEEFMLVSAFWAGEMNAVRFEARQVLDDLLVRWSKLTGWEGLVRGRTDASVEAAKRDFDPNLWEHIHFHKCRIRDLDTEIDRLDRDATKVSRAYTMLVGAP
jgi:hypothetical protein